MGEREAPPPRGRGRPPHNRGAGGSYPRGTPRRGRPRVPRPETEEGGAPPASAQPGSGGQTAATHRALLGHHFVQPPGDAHDLLLPAHGAAPRGGRCRGGPGGSWRQLPGAHHSPRYRSPGGRRAGHDGSCSPPGARPPLPCAPPSGRTTTPSMPRARPAPPRGTLGAVVRPLGTRRPPPRWPAAGARGSLPPAVPFEGLPEPAETTRLSPSVVVAAEPGRLPHSVPKVEAIPSLMDSPLPKGSLSWALGGHPHTAQPGWEQGRGSPDLYNLPVPCHRWASLHPLFQLQVG